MAAYTAAERRRIAAALHEGEPLLCPACDAPLVRSEVAPKREVGYVRRRVLLICSQCRRSAAVDLRSGGPP